MLDIKLLRDNPKEIEEKLKTKDPEASLKEVLELDERIRKITMNVEELKAKRNALSKEIGEKKRKGEDVSASMKEVGGLGDEIAAFDQEVVSLKEKCNYHLASLPNIPQDGIKVSLDPADNVCLKTFGEKPAFAFPFKNHLELSEKLGLFDFVRGTKVTGSGWPTYRGLGARLEWALINYMLDVHLENGFEQWMVPLLAKEEILYASGQLPKFADQSYKLRDKDFDFYLIPTAEVALNGLHTDEIIEEEHLPFRYCAYTPCFRREAGAAGKQERGLIRTHQFNKVEMFAFTTPDQSEALFDQMVASAEQILQGLGLHYRNMLLVTGDMSFASTKTIDVEVWLPGQDRYYEVSSISNCTDFQSRRSKTRFRKKGGKPELVHTLNGSGLATSRLMVALLENNQRSDGSVAIPQILHKYLNGLTELI